MKICTKCGLEKQDSDFARHPKTPDNLQRSCRQCHSNYSKSHYRNNRQQYYSGNKIREERSENCVIQYLRSHHCVDCSESDLRCLDFDHVRGEKRFNISEGPSMGLSWFSILREIEKCDVRCANCHRKRHNKFVRKHFRVCGLKEKALVLETSG
jgi:hypothetical protein